MECLLCGRPFDADDDAVMFDEMLSHLKEEHPEAIEEMEGWSSYEQWVDAAETEGEDE